MAKLILVVEDESAIREFLVNLIDDEDEWSATGASSGFQALGLLRSTSFDLISLDLSLPECDGNTFLKELDNIAPLTPVIVVSATPYALTIHSQVKAVVAKPFDIDQLMEVIQEFIE